MLSGSVHSLASTLLIFLLKLLFFLIQHCHREMILYLPECCCKEVMLMYFHSG